MRAKFKRFSTWFSTPKVTVAVNAICALLFFIDGVRTFQYPDDHWVGGMVFFIAMIFAASAGLHLALHVELKNKKLMDEILQNQDEFIDELISELRMLREKDAS